MSSQACQASLSENMNVLPNHFNRELLLKPFNQREQSSKDEDSAARIRPEIYISKRLFYLHPTERSTNYSLEVPSNIDSNNELKNLYDQVAK